MDLPQEQVELTRHSCRLGEAPEDLWVDVDGQLLLLDESLVTGLDNGLRPLGEGLTDEGVHEVDEPLAG